MRVVEDLTRRTAPEVLDDHLYLANDWVQADLARVLDEDLRRNVAEDVVVLINRGAFRGTRSAAGSRMLAEEAAGARGVPLRTSRSTDAWAFWSGPTGLHRPGPGRRRLLPDRGRQDRGADDSLHARSEVTERAGVMPGEACGGWGFEPRGR